MDEARRKRISEGLARDATMSADDLAATKGEGNAFVQIKRNSERLNACDRHEFEPQPNWREAKRPLSWNKVPCRRCGGAMPMDEAISYLRGFAHGTGGDFKAMCEAVWPPARNVMPT